jgi:predicted transcriptional regulator
MATDRATRSRTEDADTGRFRSRLAGWIVGLSVVGISLLSAATIVLATTDNTQAETTRLVFGSVLPLFGTWVGTILAFYFARENFAAATESTLRLTGQLTAETPVSDAMIPRSAMMVHQLAAGEGEAEVPLRALVDRMQMTGFKRIPVLEADGAVVWVIHESLILSYAQFQSVSATDDSFLGESLADLRSVPALRALSEAIAFVDKRARVRDARERMRATSGCNDVFVTETGAPTEAVVGWITNTLLAGAI